MCGLAAIFAYHRIALPVDATELKTIRDHMASRGPDGAASWLDDDRRIGLGHRRLAIIDLDARAAQPMTSTCGRYRIVYNGEIYNYRELREDLVVGGVALRTTSDTEVLLELWARQGTACLKQLRGMFAFAVWDAIDRTLTLVRDSYGIKPLYYADDGWTLRAASQVKALLAGGQLSRDPDPAGVVGFYLWGSVPEPWTTWAAICAVPAGHYVRIDSIGAGAPVAYAALQLVYHSAAKVMFPADPRPLVREAILESVSGHLVADVPVGLFLSAGIDSTAIITSRRGEPCSW
jgi:asparagine synthase (glutamine-hydrolysing)